jgi:hypothetical protein
MHNGKNAIKILRNLLNPLRYGGKNLLILFAITSIADFVIFFCQKDRAGIVKINIFTILICDSSYSAAIESLEPIQMH